MQVNKFAGVKKLCPCLRKKEQTDEDLWNKILEEVEYPYCPSCQTQMIITKVFMEFKVESPHILVRTAPFSFRRLSPYFEIELKCPNCGCTVEGEGNGFVIKSGNYSFDEIRVKRIIDKGNTTLIEKE